jgi:hypothetical protein
MNVRITRIVTEHGLEYYRAIAIKFPGHYVASDKFLDNLIRRLDDHNYSIVNTYENDGNTYKINTKYE